MKSPKSPASTTSLCLVLNVVGGHHPRLEVLHGEGGESILLLEVAPVLGRGGTWARGGGVGAVAGGVGGRGRTGAAAPGVIA